MYTQNMCHKTKVCWFTYHFTNNNVVFNFNCKIKCILMGVIMEDLEYWTKLLFIGIHIQEYNFIITLFKSNFEVVSCTHHICNLIFFPPNSTVLILKSIPAKQTRQENNIWCQQLLIILRWRINEFRTNEKKLEMNLSVWVRGIITLLQLNWYK